MNKNKIAQVKNIVQNVYTDIKKYRQLYNC